eukprot:gene2926-3366_t
MQMAKIKPSEVYQKNSKTNGSSNSLSLNPGNQQQFISNTLSPKFYHSPRLSRHSSPSHSPHSASPFSSPNTSPNPTHHIIGDHSQQQHQQHYPLTKQNSSPTITNHQIFLPVPPSNVGTNFGGSGTSKSTDNFYASDPNAPSNELEDIVGTDDSIEEIKFGHVNCSNLFNEIQEELEQMMIENSLGEFVKSKTYQTILGSQGGNSLP